MTAEGPYGTTIEYSTTKDRLNRSNHKISLGRVSEFDFDSAIIFPEDSQDYGEPREIAIGFLAGTLYVVVYVPVTDMHFRVISLRKATAFEETVYASH